MHRVDKRWSQGDIVSSHGELCGGLAWIPGTPLAVQNVKPAEKAVSASTYLRMVIGGGHRLVVGLESERTLRL
jgi:hypothetical protein